MLRSILNHERGRAIVAQIVAMGGLVALILWLLNNASVNMEKRGLEAGFDFLNSTAGFQILFSPFTEFTPGISTFLDTFFVGIGNTLLIAVFGIIAATLIGFLMGVARLSNNWLVNRLALCYIELFRNIPLLLQTMFWYFAILIPSLPSFKNTIHLSDNILLNNSGLVLPAPVVENVSLLLGIVVALILATLALHRWGSKRQAETGKLFPVWITTFIGWAVVSCFALFVLDVIELAPAVKGRFNYIGGWNLIPEFTALWVALSIYTSAFIAEIVRAGIESVPKGQVEAARALNLKPSVTLRLIIIPQALRLIIPPQTSQYLNLVKNSSLATAIGYPDLVAVFAGTTLNIVGKAIEIIAMTMLVYLTISLTISFFMNIYNKRMALIER